MAEALGPKQGRLLVLNHRFEGIAEQCFTADHRRGGQLAAQALLKMQHRKYAVITGPSTSPDNVARLEGFMDELALATGMDPVAFRLAHLKHPREIAVVKAAAERAGWTARVSPRADQRGADVARGRGIAGGAGARSLKRARPPRHAQA